MLPRPHTLPAAPSWTPASLTSIALIVLALAAAAGSWLHARYTMQQVAGIELQMALADAHEARSLACMDLVQAGLADPAGAELAKKRLNISNGITLCLVKNREAAQVSLDGLSQCIFDLGETNLISVSRPGGIPDLRPAC